MIRSVQRAAIAAIILVSGCNDSTSPNSASGALGGVWDWSGHYVSTGSSVACNDTGSFVFAQTDSSFAGTSEHVDTCSGSGSPGPFHTLDSIRAGTMHGTAITFSIYASSGGGFLCSDTAVLSTATTATLSGIASCGSATLTWQATRGAAVTSVVVTPDTARTVVGGSWSFDAELRTALGTRVFGRAITWAASPSGVATLAALPIGTLVTATGAGTATLTAMVASVSGTGALVVAPPAGLSGVSAGDARTCAFTATGAVSCWGSVFAGTSASAVPAPLASTLHFTAVTVGGEFACGLVSPGTAYCWGANESGQLGNGSTTASSTPVAVGGALSFASISAGYRYACGLTAAGAAYCWGENPDGQLGTGNTTPATSPTAVTGGVAFASISARLNHTCGTSPSGTLYCWGDNTLGQIGDNSTTQRSVPTRVSGSNTYSAVSVGATATCALSSGTAYCWGAQIGQFGSNILTPTAVSGTHTFSAISVGDDHACALASGGVAWCWGANTWGQLGDGTKTSSAAPVAVTGGLALATISAGVYFYSDEGHSSHSCGVTTGGLTYCWGDNLIGQLGNGTHTESAVPIKVAGQP